MPRRHSPPTLRALCVERVAEVQVVGDAGYLRIPTLHGPDSTNQDLDLNMYYGLDESALHSVLKAISKSPRFPKDSRLLRLLIRPETQTVELSEYEWSVDRETAHFLASHCQNLSKLELYKCSQIGTAELSSIIQSNPHLQHLNLSGTACDDRVLKSISQCCPRLMHLNLNSCDSVCDDGILHLCGDPSYDRTPCANLVHLDITNTKVEEMGVTIALVKLKKLETFLCTTSVFKLMASIHQVSPPVDQNTHQRDPPVDPHECYSLKTFSLSSPTTHDDAKLCLQVACDYCPDLREITVAEVDDVALHPLLKLKHLERLVIENNYLTADGISGILWACGQTLTEVSLENVAHLDLCAIGNWCLHLASLTLKYTETFNCDQLEDDEIETESHSGPCTKSTCTYFRRLHTLYLHQEWDIHIFSQHSLQVLLRQARQLQSVRLYGLGTLSQDTFTEVLPDNDLHQLRELTLQHCHNFSPKTLRHLVESENNLEKLVVHSCDLVTPEHQEELKAIVQSKNYNLEIEFY